jgi:hypothetical protein
MLFLPFITSLGIVYIIYFNNHFLLMLTQIYYFIYYYFPFIVMAFSDLFLKVRVFSHSIFSEYLHSFDLNPVTTAI